MKVDRATDLGGLLRGDKASWDGFVRRFSPLIYAAVRRVAGSLQRAEQEDLTQDVFVRLCKDDYRLLRQYDPARASLGTWLSVVGHSTAKDALRRRHGQQVPLDEVPAEQLGHQPRIAERFSLPEQVLSERQRLVLRLLYDHDLDVKEVAGILDVDAQTVRSTRHKALQRLREFFRRGGGDGHPAANV